MIARMNMQIIEIPWFEADDVIGTLATRLGQESTNEIYILSWDKDLYALVNEQVKVYDTQRKKISGPQETFEKFWVPANCVRDYLAICGDTSDNIPGIDGIGPVKAQILLNYFWTLEKIYEAIDTLQAFEISYDELPEEVWKNLKWKTLEKFIAGKENAFLSQKLATLATDVSLPDFDLSDFEFSKEYITTPELIDFFEVFEFHSLIRDTQKKLSNWTTLGKKVQIVWENSALEELSLKLANSDTIVLDTETTDLDVRKAELVWVSILLSEHEIYYINRLHSWPKVGDTNLQIFINSLLSSKKIIIWHNLKYDLQILEIFLEKDFAHTQDRIEEVYWQTSLEI